jgi:hypothetical protein
VPAGRMAIELRRREELASRFDLVNNCALFEETAIAWTHSSTLTTPLSCLFSAKMHRWRVGAGDDA